jgi:hypothetical protein
MNPARVPRVIMATPTFRIARGLVGADRYGEAVIGEAAGLPQSQPQHVRHQMSFRFPRAQCFDRSWLTTLRSPEW